MQDALKTLSDYWTSRGCMVAQPFNSEVGAGTMNPATILRVLGPEPWHVAYVEPSVRPDDSRYGENPNRLQTFTQFQVILKPEPGDPQELYLGSLEALGIDLAAHDVRFVEDNWAQPAIGAWGLGWEVWLDGTEITQFTYFQQVGGINLDPVPVELTYGIERILMAAQGVSHFKDIAYAPGITYGEAFGQAEYEMSCYYLDEADVSANRGLYETYVAEAQRLIDARLPVPAHSYILKSSHAFNVLDARGAISTTERAQAFKTMRTLARKVSLLWLDRRAELDHPLGVVEPKSQAVCAEPTTDLGNDPHNVVFEIGCEELPPHVVPATIASVEEAIVAGLAASKLPHGDVYVSGTPRRIIAQIQDVGAREPDSTMQRKGPKWQAAFDADGNPTKPLLGFLKGQGADPEDVVQATFGKNEHACVTINQPGRDVLTVLRTILTDAVTGLRADKNMRWNDPELTFSRAIRWLVAMWGEHTIPVAVSSLLAGNETYLHRVSEEPRVTIHHADELAEVIAHAGITVDLADRRDVIVQHAQRLAAEVGGHIDVDAEASLIDEITNLVEEPVPVRGDFDAKYLALPEQILTSVMRKHQRYLPVRDQDGTLLPYFVTMANGPCDTAVVAQGNAQVLRARYEDASFFWAADQKIELEQFSRGLEKLTFESRVGSVAQRAVRIAQVAHGIGATVAALSDQEQATLRRAGQLAKFDLATSMVTEMSSLAGYMAQQYAIKAGETPEVAEALYEMELPRTSSDSTPASTPGALLAVADRADLLMAMFAIGAKPTGSSDPYALRRAALGLARIIRECAALHDVQVSDVLATAAAELERQGIEVPAAAIVDAAEFVHSRFAQLLRDEGTSAELVAVIEPLLGRPAAVASALVDAADCAQLEGFKDLVAGLVRIGRIVPAGVTTTYDVNVLTEPAELALAKHFAEIDLSADTLPEYTRQAASLVPLINTFFDEVLVMAKDESVKSARLGLLQSIAETAPRGLDYQALDTWLGM